MSVMTYGQRKSRLAHVGNHVIMVHSCLATTGEGKIFSLVPSPSCQATIIKSISQSVRLFDVGQKTLTVVKKWAKYIIMYSHKVCGQAMSGEHQIFYAS